MAERLNLLVEDGVGDLLTKLAGGERKRGQYLSELLTGMAATDAPAGLDVALLQMAVQGLAGQMRTVEGRVAVMESRWQAQR